MPESKNLLVVINPGAKTQIALEKAARIAAGGDRITALLPAGPVAERCRESLEAQLENLRVLGLKACLETTTETNLQRAVLVAQHQHDTSLLLKEPQASSLTDSLFTPLDWKILRTSQTPVLMVRQSEYSADAPVLAAIEAQPADAEHQALSHRILQLARDMSHRLSAELCLFSAEPAPMQDALHESGNPILFPGNAADEYRQSSLALAHRYDVPVSRVHIAQGPAEVLIPEQAKRLNAGLVVLGTVARAGLSGVLLGNTGEQILERVSTDVLVIPPLPEKRAETA
ncbi:universal stress protein [Marinobacterium lutimaris]|uniref:Nucleotide-binding universal stress protein, UspA family n=1 Tax=Marinobacterium lutimaris TaxID=568106 RepID=A0A1H5VUM7_9GAMM|nr:universal stress protein [Marinobacterium lutimaris]SEF90706.1 Nucleotide-binding universal stress protein, UspA family [Marinobacterium lutimaris]